jgi:hypothetical protein
VGFGLTPVLDGAAVCDQLHSGRDIDEAWSDADCDTVYAGVCIGVVSRALKGGGISSWMVT